MRAAALSFLVAVVLATAPARAQAPAQVETFEHVAFRLSFRGVDGCPGERALRSQVAAWVGYDPFSGSGDLIKVWIDRAGGVFAGSFSLAGSCPACSCSPASGTCGPPPHMSASTLGCNGGAGAIITPSDGPPGWDGTTCTDAGALSAGALCNGVPCVRSLSVAPLALQEQGCMPSSVITKDFPQPTWQEAALACRGTLNPLGACADHHLTCVPGASPPDFRACVYASGDKDCPASYPDKHLVYAGFADTRDCTACGCGAPAGGACTGTLTVFKDGACSSQALLLSDPIGSASPSCFDLVPAGPSLGSKTVTALTYQPGACAPSGGEATGSVDPAGASTFCCLS